MLRETKELFLSALGTWPTECSIPTLKTSQVTRIAFQLSPCVYSLCGKFRGHALQGTRTDNLNLFPSSLSASCIFCLDVLFVFRLPPQLVVILEVDLPHWLKYMIYFCSGRKGFNWWITVTFALLHSVDLQAIPVFQKKKGLQAGVAFESEHQPSIYSKYWESGEVQLLLRKLNGHPGTLTHCLSHIYKQSVIFLKNKDPILQISSCLSRAVSTS